MSDTPAGHRHHPGRYEIRLHGHLGSHWSARFEGLTVTNQPDGTTLIEGPVVDQAALHGLLRTLRDIGIPLLSLHEVAWTTHDHPEQGEPDEAGPYPNR